jgi:F0F1-type ATP synthase membrane subunit b/b'
VTTLKQIRQAARKNGSTSTAIFRHSVEQALTSNEEAVERHIAATLDQIRGDLSRMQRVQQTLFAFVDTLAEALVSDLSVLASDSRDRLPLKRPSAYYPL